MTKTEFNTMVLHQTGSLRMYALNFTRDSEDANDLVQDTLLKAITYYDKFKEGTNLKGWLYTIMKNTFINNYRRVVKMNSLVTKSDEIPSSSLLHSATHNNAEGKFVMKDRSEEHTSELQSLMRISYAVLCLKKKKKIINKIINNQT